MALLGEPRDDDHNGTLIIVDPLDVLIGITSQKTQAIISQRIQAVAI